MERVGSVSPVKRIADSQYLLEVRLLRDKVPSFKEYPFSLPAVRHLHSLKFHPKVTFIIGENATGKSTLLEAIAVACGLTMRSETWTTGQKRPHSPRGEFERGGGPPLSVGLVGRAPRLPVVSASARAFPAN